MIRKLRSLLLCEQFCVHRNVPYISRHLAVHFSIGILEIFGDLVQLLAQVDLANEVQHELLMHISNLAQRRDESLVPLSKDLSLLTILRFLMTLCSMIPLLNL